MTKAILVVSFGTTYPETRKRTIEACEKVFQERFPDFEVYRAFTSNYVIRKVKEKEGLDVWTVSQALENLKNLGVHEVYIQPLHVILGSEYQKIVHQAQAFSSSFERLKISKPLLHSESDYQAVCSFLVKEYGSFGKGQVSILMGHGSQHYAFTTYAAMDHMLNNSSVYIGCVESYPSVDLIEERLKSHSVEKIHLAPFMLVAGDHAIHDLSSKEKNSWYRYFKDKGYQVETHLVGLGEFEAIQSIYVQHLEKVMKE